MKSVVDACVQSSEFGIKDFKITKAKLEYNAAMSDCFHTLKEMVPSVPQNKRISTVALLQHVIDYILDLEITLDIHPAAASIPPPLAAVCRSPLAEKMDFNTREPAVGMKTNSTGVCELRPPSK